jgi:hypothetical protein
MTYYCDVKVVRLKPYLRACKAMSLDDADMRKIELELIAAPEAHPVIKGLRGVRKARIALPRRGKRGGGRVIYFITITPSVMFMLTAYPKNAQDDLTNDQRKAILSAIENILGDK